jgi:hypothetical protein
MPQPTSLAGTQGPAYLCGNVRCRYQTYEKLRACPQCGRTGNFVLASSVAVWNLVAGIMFTMIGVLLTTFGVAFFVGLASGRLTPGEYGWWGTAILPAIGAVFVLGGISTIKGYSWFVWLLLIFKR